MAKTKLDKMREQVESVKKTQMKIKFVEKNTDKLSDSLCTAIEKHDAETVTAASSIFTKNINVFCDAIDAMQSASKSPEEASQKVSNFEYALLKIIPMTADFCNEFERTAVDARFDKFVDECNKVIELTNKQKSSSTASANDATVSS